MPNHNPKTLPLATAVISTLALLWIAALTHSDSMWGANHLRFLPTGYWYLFGLGSLLVALSLFRPTVFSLFSLDIESWKSRAVIAISAGLLFYLIRIDTFLLGDGYAWLSIMGRGANFIHKWTEPGSILIIRAIQSALGGYTQANALLAFQTVSVISGIIVWYNLLSIAIISASKGPLRTLLAVTLLASGTTLLFTGYVEFYPILWAAATTFIYQALRYLKDRKRLWLVLLAFLLSALMHLQALYFILAVTYLILEKVSFRFPALRSRNLVICVSGVILLLGVAVFYWLYDNLLEFEVIFLPFFQGRSASPDYAVFSVSHLRDIVNLIFLIFPGALILIALRIWHTTSNAKPATPLSPTALFLVLCSLGSVSFLIMIDPVIGMARDWDLFSLTVLPPLLLFFLWLRQIDEKRLGQILIPYTLICIIATGAFLAANITTESAQNRFHSILRYYGAKERSGWVLFANYLKERGDSQGQLDLLAEMAKKFPEDKSLEQFYALLSRHKYQPALKLAREMYRKDSYRGDFLQALGNVFRRLKVFDSSDYYFNRAITLRPHNSMLLNEYGQSLITQGRLNEALQVLITAHYYSPTNSAIMEGIGLAHYKMNQYDSTSLIADSLFIMDQNSPGGHLLRLIVALQNNSKEEANRHFKEYKKHGRKRSDYRNILEYYGYLEE